MKNVYKLGLGLCIGIVMQSSLAYGEDEEPKNPRAHAVMEDSIVSGQLAGIPIASVSRERIVSLADFSQTWIWRAEVANLLVREFEVRTGVSVRVYGPGWPAECETPKPDHLDIRFRLGVYEGDLIYPPSCLIRINADDRSRLFDALGGEVLASYSRSTMWVNSLTLAECRAHLAASRAGRDVWIDFQAE